MSHDEHKRASQWPEASPSRRPPARRDSQAAAALPSEPQHRSLPELNMRHDGRSALHSILGFVELVESGGLGPVTEQQRTALKHVYGSALTLFELLESSLDLAEASAPPSAGEAPVCLAHVVTHAANSFAREVPELHMSLRGQPQQRLWVAMAPDTLRQVLRMLLELLARTAQPLTLQLWHTDLHAGLSITAGLHEPLSAHGLPSPADGFGALEGLRELLDGRAHLRLTRCEALLARHRGRLLLTRDLRRVALVLPRHGA